MAALMRCCFPRHLNLGHSMVRLLSVSSRYGFSIPTTHRSTPAALKDKETLVSQINRKIDLNLGVSNDLFQMLYSSCEKNADSLTDNDAALLLYICSLGPFDSPVHKRAKIADEIWNKLEHFGVSPSVKLYNIRLKVYIANRTPFNPLEELKKMRTLGLNPDRGTYGLLLERFCQQGDIAAANNVLEAMKNAGYLIGIGTFNTFITGHLKAGSPEEATNVVEVLRSRGLIPDAETYSRFAIHYAEEGDIDSVLKYVSTAEDEGVDISHTTLLDLYRIIIMSGHSSKAEPLLKIISEKGIYKSTAMQKCCHLASEGLTEAALKLYTTIPKLDDDRFQYNNGSFLLKAMIYNGQSTDDVMAVADQLAESDVKSLPHRNSLLYAYKGDRTDLAVQLLELMKAKNHEIKVPHIIPAICSYRKSGNKQGLHKVVRMLLELDGDHYTEDKMDGLLTFAYPALTNLQESRQDIINDFQDYEKSWNLIFFMADLAKGYKTALKNASGKELDTSFFHCYDFRQQFISSFNQDPESCVEVLDYLSQQGMKQGLLMSITGHALKLSGQSKNWDLVDKIVTALQKKNLKVRRGITQFQFYIEAPEQLRTKIDQLCVSGSNDLLSGHQHITYQQLESMTIQELDNYQQINPTFKLAHIALLDKVLETNDLNCIKQKILELQARGVSLSIVQLVKLVPRFANLGDTKSALNYFKEMKQVSGGNFRKMVPLNLAIDLAKAGNISAAVEMIRVTDESTFPKDEWAEKRKLWALRSILKNALTLDDASKLHSEIFQTTCLLQSNETMKIHAAYITRVLAEDNDGELLARLVKLHDTYQVFPCMEHVMIRFIQKQDVALLKKVMDLGISVFGSNNFHLKLALCFIECGLPSKAAAVLQTPGLKIYERSLIYACQHFLKGKKIECLESFATITKDLPVSKGLMLKYLLEGYIAVNNLPKAMEIMDRFAENFISPLQETVALLVRAYISHNLAVPESLRAYTSESERMSKGADTSSSSSDSDSSSSEMESEGDKDPEKKTSGDDQEQKLNIKHSPSEADHETNLR